MQRVTDKAAGRSTDAYGAASHGWWRVVSGVAGLALICMLQASGEGGPPVAEAAHATQGRIAFASGRDGNSEVYVMQADGSGPVRLTNNAAADFAPAWSPDGTRIAFVSEREGAATVYVMRADGSDVRRLPRSSADSGGAFAPAWSPDGSRIVFERRGDRGATLYVIGADGSAPRPLLLSGPPFQANPSWSPDGRRIAFVGSFPNAPGALYVANADGSGLRALTDAPGFYDWPTWSPDGRTILFANDDGSGSTQIYTISAGGGTPTRLTDAASQPTGALAPAWSPDGTRITFVSRRDGNLEVYAMDVSGRNQTRLTNHPSFDLDPDWEPLHRHPTSPVSKDDCKNDGWRRFTNPSFKNQGQCVSSVGRR